MECCSCGGQHELTMDRRIKPRWPAQCLKASKQTIPAQLRYRCNRRKSSYYAYFYKRPDKARSSVHNWSQTTTKAVPSSLTKPLVFIEFSGQAMDPRVWDKIIYVAGISPNICSEHCTNYNARCKRVDRRISNLSLEQRSCLVLNCQNKDVAGHNVCPQNVLG